MKNNSKAAPQTALEELHKHLADSLSAAIRTGVPVVDAKTGEVLVSPAPAAILNVARQFLKDNNIEAAPVDGGHMKGLAASLPFAGSNPEDAYSEPQSQH